MIELRKKATSYSGYKKRKTLKTAGSSAFDKAKGFFSDEAKGERFDNRARLFERLNEKRDEMEARKRKAKDEYNSKFGGSVSILKK